MSDSNTKDGIITLVAITFVNALNYGLNLILGRWLGPEGFAEASILATMVLILSFVGVAIQITAAKEVALRTDGTSQRDQFLKWYESRVMKVGLIVGGVVLLASPWISSFLQMRSLIPAIIVFLGIPFYFGLSGRRGYFQGAQSFMTFSMTFIVETVTRLIITILTIYLALQYAPEYAIHGVALGFLLSFIATYLYTRLKHKITLEFGEIADVIPREIYVFLASIGVYELSQILINNCDVLLVKHYFDEYQAGIYAAIALVGRMVYFGTWTIVTLLFPKVIEKEKKGESHTGLFYGSLLIVGVCGLFITGACYWQGTLIMTLLFGDAFADASSLLWTYALSTTIFACANVFAYYYMSLDKYLPVALSLLIGIAQLVCIAFYHENLGQVIEVQIVGMSVLLVSMIGFHVYREMVKGR